jgi:hypothetical protein
MPEGRFFFVMQKKISVLGDTAEGGGAPILKRPKGEFCRAERVSGARLFEVLRGNRQMTFVRAVSFLRIFFDAFKENRINKKPVILICVIDYITTDKEVSEHFLFASLYETS